MDYQLVEEEGGDGITRVILRVRPSVGPLDSDAVVEVVLAALARTGVVGRNQAALWSAAGTLTVVREPALSTTIGKVLPFHLIRRNPDGEANAPSLHHPPARR